MLSAKFPRALWMITMSAVVLSGPFIIANRADAAEPEKVTFSNQVVRILQEKCQDCHRAGTVAPMSLETFEESRPWARIDQRAGALREHAALKLEIQCCHSRRFYFPLISPSSLAVPRVM